MAASMVFAQTPQPMRKVCKAVTPPNEEDEIVFEVPDGELSYYSRSCESFQNDYFDGLTKEDIKGSVVKTVYVAEEGTVWLSNPLSDFVMLSYVKGSVEADGSIVIEGPQFIYDEYDDWTEEVVKIYLIPMKKVIDEYGATFVANDDMKYVLKKTETGYEAEDPEILLGLATYGELADLQGNPTGELGYAWLGWGERAIVLDARTETNGVNPPEGATVEKWAFTDPYESALIGVAVDGNDMYIQGIDRGVKDAWVKGTIADGKVTIPSGSYLGYNPEIAYYSYLWGASLEDDISTGELRGTPTEQVVFAYDAEAKRLTLDDGYAICSMPEDFYLLTLYDDVTIECQNRDVNALPAEPYDVLVTPCDDYFGVGSIDFYLPNYDENHDLLEKDKLYYTIYVANEVFTFTPEEFPYLELTEATTKVPFSLYDNYNIFISNTFHSIYFNSELPENGCGVQSVYINEEGRELRSAIVWYGETGVGAVDAGKNVVSRSYYNLQGQPVSSDYNGFVISRTVYDDGTVKVAKTAKRH